MADQIRLPELPWAGGCRCGRVRFRITKRPMLTGVCHCRGCQRMTASAFSTTVAVPTGGFAVTAGETAIGGTHAGRAGGEHHHCGHCKSWLFTCLPDAYGVVNVRATMLDEAGWFLPYMETQTAEMLPWAKTPAAVRFARFPDDSQFPEIIAGFAKATGD